MGEVADPDECKRIAVLGVDFLAAGIGNIHGVYPPNWKGLDFGALAKIQAETGELPLVLHGGTGIPSDMKSSFTHKYSITRAVPPLAAPVLILFYYSKQGCQTQTVEREKLQ